MKIVKHHGMLYFNFKKLIIIPFFITLNSIISATTYYVSTTGNDANPGTLSLPWATWQKAFASAETGDTVFIRGGTYFPNPSSTIYPGQFGVFVVSPHKGTAGSQICIFNYPGEKPILNIAQLSSEGVVSGLYLWGLEYWHLKGLTVTGGNQLATELAGGMRFRDCNYCVFEQLESYNNEGPGIILYGNSSNNIILNCDAWDNYDINSSVPGNNADGFLISYIPKSASNIIRGCRAWNNSDDGFDTYANDGILTIDNCWSFNQGLGNGNGCGFKLWGTNAELFPQRIVFNCIAFHNKYKGFDQSESYLIINLYNNVSYYNYEGFGFDSRNSACIIKNNISFNNTYSDYSFLSNMIVTNNSWQNGITVSDADFASLDATQLQRKRKDDGSLPDIDFLHLASSSDLIDLGVDVGLPYYGNAPDLGAFETQIGSDASVPKYISSVIENASPSKLDLTFNLALANIVPSVSAFDVRVNSNARSVSSVAISGTKVSLTLSSAVTYGDIVTVAYSKPATNPLQTVEGGQAASFSAQTVSNKIVAPSPAVPGYVSSSIENATPSKLDITYSLSLANIIPATSAFTVRVNSNSRSVSSVAISGTKVSLTLSAAVAFGDVVTVAYTKPSTNPLQTTEGGQAASFSAQTVTNKLAAPAPTPAAPIYISSSVENATPSKLDIVFNLSLANIIPATSAFMVTVNASARSVSSVAVSGTKVTLTLASSVVYGDVITVAYNKPSSNPLQTSEGGQAASFTAKTVTNRISAPPPAPAIPVYVSSSVENAAPTKIDINFNLTLTAIVPPASAFTVMVNSSSRAFSSVAVSGTKVTLTLSSAIAFGNVITVAYTKPASNQLQTAAGGQVASFTAQPVSNKVAAVNNNPVLVVNSPKNSYSGFVYELNATGSYDSDKDNLTFTWTAPSNVPVSSTSGPILKFLGPIVSAPVSIEFTVKISDGKSIVSKNVPVEILPYKPDLEAAEIVDVEASSYYSQNYPYNIIDGNIGTMWSANGLDQWLVIELKESFNVQHVKLAFQSGQKNESYFDILGSVDKVSWEPILTKSASCGFSGDLQVFDFPPAKAEKEYKYVKVIGRGNSADAWNYISELKIYGYRHHYPSSFENLSVKLYPNPAHELINIRIDEPSLSFDFIKIFNLNGKIVYQDILDKSMREFVVPLSIQQGMYMIQMGSDNLTLYSAKIIVSSR